MTVLLESEAGARMALYLMNSQKALAPALMSTLPHRGTRLHGLSLSLALSLLRSLAPGREGGLAGRHVVSQDEAER